MYDELPDPTEIVRNEIQKTSSIVDVLHRDLCCVGGCVHQIVVKLSLVFKDARNAQRTFRKANFH